MKSAGKSHAGAIWTYHRARLVNGATVMQWGPPLLLPRPGEQRAVGHIQYTTPQVAQVAGEVARTVDQESTFRGWSRDSKEAKLR